MHRIKRRFQTTALFLLTAVLFASLLLPLTVQAEDSGVAWVANEHTVGDWWYFSKDNSGTVVSDKFSDPTREADRTVTIEAGELNRFGGNKMSFTFRFEGTKADNFANVGIPVEVNLDKYGYFYYSIASIPKGGVVEVKLGTRFAESDTIVRHSEPGAYYLDLEDVYPDGGKQAFWVNFALSLPNRTSGQTFVFDYAMIGNEDAPDYDIDHYERTVEPFSLDFEEQAWVYYGKNDQGNVRQDSVHSMKEEYNPLSFEYDYPETDGVPGMSLVAAFKWPEGSLADYWQQYGVQVKVDLDDTPYLYFSTDFGRSDWFSVGVSKNGFTDTHSASLDETEKYKTGAHVLDVRSILGGGVQTLWVCFCPVDLNYDGSEFVIDYMYFGNHLEAPPSDEEPTPTATPTPTESPTEAPTDTPAPTVTEKPAVSPTEKSTDKNTSFYLGAAALFVLAVLALLVGIRKKKTPLVVLALVLAVVGVVLTVLAMQNPAEPTADATPTPTEEVTPEPTRKAFTATEDEGATVHLTVKENETDVLRQETVGYSRMLTLRLVNATGGDLADTTLTYEDGGKTVKRTLYAVKKDATVFDTAWIDSTFEGLLPAKLTDASGKVLWSGTLAVSQAVHNYIIPLSHCYDTDELEPGMLRGANYFNRLNCWGGDWAFDDYTEQWNADFSESVSKLHINAIRAFTILGNDMLESGYAVKAETLIKIGKFLDCADRNGLKVILCLNSGFYPGYREDVAENARFLRSITEMLQNDGRILAFDLANEIDCGDALNTELKEGKMGTVSRFITEMYPRLRDEWAPNHITMIGTGYMISNIKKLGIETELGSYHGYIQTNLAGSRVADNYMRMADETFDGKEGDWVMEEWGFSSEDKNEVEDEAFQKEVYESYIYAFRKLYSEGYRMLGTFQWCIYDYVPEAKVVVVERKNGVIKADGTVKPAGELLAAFYAELQASTPAPWDK